MSGDWFIYLAAAAAGLALSGLFSGAETGIYCVNRVRVQLGNERNERAARQIWRLLAEEQTALSVMLIGTNVANYATTAVVALFLGRELGLGDRSAELYTTAVVTPVIFTFGEVVPKNLFRVAADHLMYRLAPVLLTARLLLWPMAWAVRYLATRLNRLFESPEAAGDAPFAARRRVAAVLREGLIHAGRDAEHFELVERVMALPHTPLHAVMVPRNRVVTISADADRQELIALARKRRYTRLPVFDRNRRRVVGLVIVHEALARTDWERTRAVTQPILTLQPRESVAATILKMQTQRRNMGVVVDRNGLLLGLVTRKDLMEEIVGELGAW